MLSVVIGEGFILLVLISLSKLFCTLVTFVMVDFLKQHVIVKFCCFVQKKWYKTLKMLKAVYEDNVTGKIQIFEWFSHFNSGEISINDEPCSRHPSTV